MREPQTDIPGLVLNTTFQGSRVAFLPADLDRQLAQNNLPDHSKLLENLIRWASKDEIPLVVEGTGLVDCHIYHQPNRLVFHLVNLNNEAAWRQPVHELNPLGRLKIQIKIPNDVLGNTVRLLVSDQSISSKIESGWCSFEIDSVLDHEVVVIS